MSRATYRSPCRALAAIAALILGFWASAALAQVAPWQQPPGGAPQAADPLVYGHTAPATNDSNIAPGSSEDWTDEADERMDTVWGLHPRHISGVAGEWLHDRVWVRAEFLSWFTKGFAVPALLTTSPPNTDASAAGVLGRETTNILFGNTDLQSGFHPGERFVLGSWLGDAHMLGIEASYLQLARQSSLFATNITDAPILARPFFDSETGQQNSQLVNFPGQQNGILSSAATSELQAGELLLRKNLTRRGSVTIDVSLGYRCQQLNDHLAVGDKITFSGTDSGFPAGTVLGQSDRFDTRNVFNGGQIGLTASLQQPRWTLDAALKIAAGQTRSQVTIDGVTMTAIPGETVTFQQGGLLALPCNTGVFASQRFSVVPELGLTFGWNFTSCLRGTIGYDLLYWSGVARPGDQLDLNVDPRQFPPPASTTATRPQFALHTSDYWAQGINLGFDLSF